MYLVILLVVSTIENAPAHPWLPILDEAPGPQERGRAAEAPAAGGVEAHLPAGAPGAGEGQELGRAAPVRLEGGVPETAGGIYHPNHHATHLAPRGHEESTWHLELPVAIELRECILISPALQPRK